MKILIIDLLYIGDLMFVTPLIHALKDTYPIGEIDFIVDQRYQDVLVKNPFINRLIPVDRPGFRGRPLKNIRFIKEIRRSNYDMALNLHPNERTTVFTALSGAPIRCGYAKAGIFSKMYTKVVKPHGQIHMADEYLNILTEMGIPWHPERFYGLELWFDSKTEHEANQLWQDAGLTEDLKVVGINPGGSWPSKRWLPERYAELADNLTKNGLIPAFFGGITDIPLVKEIVALMKSPKPVIFTGKIRLVQLAALVKKCAVFISGDSGPVHIAASQQVPTVAIFGPTDPIRFKPYQNKHSVVKAEQPCLGCGLHKCEKMLCMKGIATQTVLNAIKKFL